MGIDFGCLFQKSDLTHRRTDSIDYDYYEEHPEDQEEIEVAEEQFARALGRVMPRLELLGFTLETARSEYENMVSDAVEIDSYVEPEDLPIKYLTFDEFCALACRYPLADLCDKYIDHDSSNRDTLSHGRFATSYDQFERVPRTDGPDFYWSEASFLSRRICILSPQSMLWVFASSEANLEIEVTWEFGPIVHAGWVERGEFQPCARQTQRFLIATEGASDARIIKRSFDVLQPDLTDFFHFVDVDERHHFWGSSNLVKFAEGLMRIEVLNKVLFVFDNDAEGVAAFRKLVSLDLPANMTAMIYPSLKEFENFATLGPEGTGVSDINGRAAAIECYLDLRLQRRPTPKVIWSNYKKDISTWHGALDCKESYAKYFYAQTDAELRNGSYDTSKLMELINELIRRSMPLESMI